MALKLYFGKELEREPNDSVKWSETSMKCLGDNLDGEAVEGRWGMNDGKTSQGNGARVGCHMGQCRRGLLPVIERSCGAWTGMAA